MQVSVELEPEMYSMAARYADANGLSLSDALNDLLRQAEQARFPASAAPPKFIRKHGLLIASATGHPITPEMVKEFSEDPVV